MNKLSFPCVDVVEASAGSGKTYALARRYIRLIMDPRLKTEESPLKAILAVTFTNKATIEMKQRILEILKKIALDIFSNEQERKNILSLPAVKGEKAGKRARRIMDEIISHYNFFQVQTIDSFMNALLSGCAFHLGFASNFRIRDNYRSYLEYSLDSLIDRLATDKNMLKTFDDFLDYYLYVENREGWFSKRDMLGLIRALYGYSNTYGGTFAKPDVDVNDMWKMKRAIIKLIREILDSAPDETHTGFINKISAFLENNKDTFEVNNLSAYFEREEFPVRKNAKVPREVARLWGDVRRNIREFCEWESYAVFKPYIEIFNGVLGDFRKLSGEDDIIFLPELNIHARSLTGDTSITVAELYYRLATRFRHYLIDEFQDTSLLQWKNIFPMVSEALSSGGSLFYVGDKKQAIYRFRGGDVSLFDTVRGELADFNPKKKYLNKNFRSQEEIVEFNNEIFSADNLRRFIKDAESSQKDPVKFSGTDIDRVLNIFSDSKQEWKEGNIHGYVSVEAFNAANVVERDIFMRGKLISLIRDLRNRFSFGDLALLARENSDVELFTSWLIEEGIPVESEKTLNMREHPLIKELISFLMFLNSPIDNLSFASFVLGDIFRKAAGLSRDAVQEFLFKARPKSRREKGAYLYREFRKRFPGAWDALIEEFFKSVGFVPLYELMISALGKFKVMENFPEYQGFFMRLLELIKEKEEEYSGLSSFLEYFEEIEQKDLYVNVTHADSVTVMTMHKAKGLEFPVVIIPFLEMDVNVGTGGGGMRKPYVIKQSDDGALNLVQLKKKYGAYSKRLGAEYRDEYIKSLIDELNALYVALTRAKHELYLFMPAKTGNKHNLARNLIPYKAHERGAGRKYEEQKAKGERPFMTLPVSRYSDWIGILKDEFIGSSELINRDRIIRGEVLHFILSFVGNLHIQDKDALLATAREKARSEFPYIKNLHEHAAVARNLLEDEKFKPFFYVKEGVVYREKEVVDPSGNTKRIDRLVVTPKEAWVIDYKSSKGESGEYQKQIAEYTKIIKPLYPKLKTRGFLIYLDTLTVEEI